MRAPRRPHTGVSSGAYLVGSGFTWAFTVRAPTHFNVLRGGGGYGLLRWHADNSTRTNRGQPCSETFDYYIIFLHGHFPFTASPTHQRARAAGARRGGAISPPYPMLSQRDTPPRGRACNAVGAARDNVVGVAGAGRVTGTTYQTKPNQVHAWSTAWSFAHKGRPPRLPFSGKATDTRLFAAERSNRLSYAVVVPRGHELIRSSRPSHRPPATGPSRSTRSSPSGS